MFFVLLSCDSLIILSNRCSFVKHFFIFLNSVLSSLSCDSLFILSKCFSFVKNFFIFFCISVLRQKKAQGVGFEPTRPCGQTVFKTASLWPLRYPCTRAGDGNRTHVSSLEGWCSTIELHPHDIGVTGFEPATSWSQTRRSSQAEPHPDMNFYPEKQVIQVLVFSVSSVTQELLYRTQT